MFEQLREAKSSYTTLMQFKREKKKGRAEKIKICCFVCSSTTMVEDMDYCLLIWI